MSHHKKASGEEKIGVLLPEEAGDIEREGTGGAFLPNILLKEHERGHTEGKRAGGEKAQITKRQNKGGGGIKSPRGHKVEIT